jgi:hypothetical protein
VQLFAFLNQFCNDESAVRRGKKEEVFRITVSDCFGTVSTKDRADSSMFHLSLSWF